MKLLRRLIDRRFGHSARRLAVRPHLPWYFWALVGALAAAAMGLGVAWALDIGRRIGGSDYQLLADEASLLRDVRRQLTSEVTSLRKRAETAEQQYSMEQAARADLAVAVVELEQENARLREDIAFFQDQFSASGGRSARIYRFELARSDGTDEYRYLVVVVQGGRKPLQFKGSIQITLQLAGADGQRESLLLPGRLGKDPRMELDFRYYQRLEGRLSIPVGKQLVKAEVHVYRQGSREPLLNRQASIDTGQEHVREKTQ